jgi:hypothetical protein
LSGNHLRLVFIGFSFAITGCFSSSDIPRVDAGLLTLDAGSDGEVADGGTQADGAGSPEGGALDAGLDAATACVPSGTPVIHTADITADETWASGIHVVPNSIHIKGGARVTVMACSEVRMGANASIDVKDAGSRFEAIGDVGSEIRIVRQDATMAWGNIEADDGTNVNLAHTTLTGGGGVGPYTNAPYRGATLVGLGSNPVRPVVFAFKQVKVEQSNGLGLFLQAARIDSASSNLTIHGAGWYPAYMAAASAGDLPAGSYTGNALDEVLLQSFDTAAYIDDPAIMGDVTIHDRGVPYLVGTTPTSIVVGDGIEGHAPASLTLEAGVTMLFTPEGSSSVSQISVKAQPSGASWQAQGALIVAGTAAKPITLDSAGATPAAGDWQGIAFWHVVDPRTSIANARIRHAGGYSSTVGICPSTPAGNNGVATCAIIALLDQAPGAFVTNTTFEAASCGVYRGWSPGDVDFLTGNTFTSITGCAETSIPSASNACTACPTR